jgi:hypothetical protein
MPCTSMLSLVRFLYSPQLTEVVVTTPHWRCLNPESIALAMDLTKLVGFPNLSCVKSTLTLWIEAYYSLRF